MLSPQEQIRYSRQILLKQFGEQGQLTLQKSTVLIVGLGGLGCPVSTYLAAAGIGKLILVDGDKVSASNLHRQVLFTPNDIDKNKAEVAQEKLGKQNPLIDIEAVDERFVKELAHSYLPDTDLIIDCTDNMESRYLLNQLCYQYEKPLIIGAATGFDGQTIFINPLEHSACYQCLFPDTENTPTDNCQTLGILSPVLAIVAGMQCLTAIKYLTNNQVTTNQLMMFDGLSQQWQHLTISPKKHCPICSS